MKVGKRDLGQPADRCGLSRFRPGTEQARPARPAILRVLNSPDQTRPTPNPYKPMGKDTCPSQERYEFIEWRIPHGSSFFHARLVQMVRMLWKKVSARQYGVLTTRARRNADEEDNGSRYEVTSHCARCAIHCSRAVS
ncbi:hypothetical protein F2Q69_00029780 [Brassica cretica]|uniref:Uncharacterized protein n=1 Tax=Brassica cretica TaxID=69181 RepID=A0A8S9RVC0_BRACR|nr:hypothetical protein F2Q69_00029780 [Brassica cretica]